MRTVAIFKNGNNRAIRLPKDLDFEGVNELEIIREGETIILRPVKPSWNSFLYEDKADKDFLSERPDIIEEGRIKL
ncbi:MULTISPECIES: type II toxin-antitoxin system VapB family antitoxin [Xenorhabdus]|uniref:Antitoxin VapB n=1 Tax=Xenorhabdus ehlersii TaxID=290111 RepID=A0A2D0IMS4_9GAMM|nr:MULTISPECIES: type II toxin-antitoxin system VapB family antitoxin [Xenorhabdus]MBC8947613.1 virulence factor [Xenorhabdus sp. TS4]PHM23130.1 virulence factor [Xenorhabdus ehlersii]RKE89121.1 antitoxin VapB [Xenorhabdus ehlersii]